MKFHTIATLTFTLGGLVNIANSQPFAQVVAVCTRELATGFNWENGKWVQANFPSGRKTIVRKIDTSYFTKNPDELRPSECMPSGKRIEDPYYKEGCYLIENEGIKKSVIFAEKCTEIIQGNKIHSVQCRNMTFNPDGQFVIKPLHANIEDNPSEGYKDSLVISVGRCRTPLK